MNRSGQLELSNKVNFLALQSYLRITGWQRQTSNDDSVSIYRLTFKHETFEIVIPLNRDFPDYDRGILDAVRTLSFIENKEVEQTLSDIILPFSDVLRFRIVSRDTETGTITFDDGFNLLENARMSLYTSACDLIQPAHKRLAFSKAADFIKNCRLGQTERGSFIASIICPFVDGPQESTSQLNMFSTPEQFTNSFTRKVTRNLMSSIQIVKKSIENDSTEELLDPEREEKISANFLQSIVNLNEVEDKTKTDLEIIPSWAPIGDIISLPKSVSISQEYLEPIKSLISRLMPKDELDVGEFIGRISQVKADPDYKKRLEGEVTFNFMDDNEKVTKAKVILNIEDYQKACEAHEFGRSVRIKGVLVSSERSKIITNPTFEII